MYIKGCGIMFINQIENNKNHGLPIIEIRRINNPINDFNNNQQQGPRAFEVINYNDALKDCFSIACFDSVYYLSDLLSVRNMKALKKQILRKGVEKFLLKTDKNYNNKIDHLICYLVNHDNRQTISIVMIPVEKTQKKQTLQKSKIEALGQLSGGIAHDFNNILSIVQGYGMLLQEQFSTGKTVDLKQVKDHLKKIIAASKKGSNLTRKLLAFSKQKIMLDQNENIAATLPEQIDLLRPILGANIKLYFEKSSDHFYIKSSPDVVNQIVTNLCINARDAMPEGGVIYVRLVQSSYKDFVSIIVNDSGTGIPKDIQKNIFDPFFTTKELGRGTGLGLSTVHGLVEQLGGYINFDSHPSRGTKFIVDIPINKNVKITSGTPQKKNVLHVKNDPFMLYNKCVVVAEDEDDLRALVVNIFKRLGMKVHEASNGDQALSLLDEHNGAVDFLVTDIVMPGINGARLAAMTREISPMTKIIMMSGYPSRQEIGQRIKDFDIDDCYHVLQKPVDMNAVICLMQNMVQGMKEEDIDKIYRELRVV